MYKWETLFLLSFFFFSCPEHLYNYSCLLVGPYVCPPLLKVTYLPIYLPPNCDKTQTVKRYNSLQNTNYHKTKTVKKKIKARANTYCDTKQIVIKHNRWKKYKFYQLKLWQNPNCDKHANRDVTQIVTKHKLWLNPNCEKTQILTKLKLWQNISCEGNINQTKIETTDKKQWNTNGKRNANCEEKTNL